MEPEFLLDAADVTDWVPSPGFVPDEVTE